MGSFGSIGHHDDLSPFFERHGLDRQVAVLGLPIRLVQGPHPVFAVPPNLLRAVLVPVGVIDLGEDAVRRVDLFGRGGRRHAEYFEGGQRHIDHRSTVSLPNISGQTGLPMTAVHPAVATTPVVTGR